MMGVGVAAAVLIASASVGRTEGAPDDLFVKGLGDRGLTTLLEAYLKQKTSGAEPSPGATPGATPGTTPGAAAGATGGEKAMLAELAVKKADGAKNVGEKEGFYKEARKFYEEAIDEGVKAFAAIPLEKTEDRNKLRIQILKQRLDLANLIYQKWLDTDIQFLEITDRRGGDRAHAGELLKVSVEQYKAIATDTAAWLSEIDRFSITERSKFQNTGYDRQLRKVQAQAKFFEACASFYYGWLLPVDYKPADKQATRKQILDEAITACMEETRILRDNMPQKWYSYILIGAAYREQGKFKEALEALAMANNKSATDSIKIRADYERARTLLRQGDFAGARKQIDDARNQWKEKLDADLYGLSLPLVEAESYILESQKSNDPAAKEKGVALLRTVSERKPPWPTVVQWVTEGLLGSQVTDMDKMDPFQLMMMAGDNMQKGKDSGDVKAMETAAALYKKYIEKTGAKDPKYAEALYSQAACLLQLGRKAEAAECFQKVAEEKPDYPYAAAAAKYTVSARGQVYDAAQTDENRQAYEDALKWFCAKWLKTDPEQQYYYAYILTRGKKFLEAGEAFAKVPETAEHYLEARYWVALCGMEQFRDKILPANDKQLVVTRARVVAQDLMAFVDFAMKANADEKKKAQLMEWAEAASMAVADIYLYPEVGLPGEAMPVLDSVEQRFKLDDEARGRVLKLRITAQQALGKLDDAQKTLDAFLKLAKPEEVGPVLRGLFKALTDDVRELIRRSQKEQAAGKVEQAKVLGDQLRDWLAKSALPDKAERIEGNRYDLAELYLAVGKIEGKVDGYATALAIYREIGGDHPEKPAKDKDGKDLPMKEDCVTGLGRIYEAMGDAGGDPKTAKDNYEAALGMWKILLAAAEGERGVDLQLVWERRYHFFYCFFNYDKQANAKDVRDALKKLEVINKGLGGKDPAIKQKFAQLYGQAIAIAGV
jgi:tetratricopeptide (TPR) repeat protein